MERKSLIKAGRSNDPTKERALGLSSFPTEAAARRNRGYNAAMLVDREGNLQGIYRKQRLVPMSEEFLPRRILPESSSDATFDWLCRNFGLPRSSDLLSGEGFVTLEISNTTPLPARIYANEEIAQVLFFQADEECEVLTPIKKANTKNSLQSFYQNYNRWPLKPLASAQGQACLALLAG